MNILIFSWRGPGHPHEGGAESVTQEHAKSWVKAGHSVTLFTSTFDGARSSEVIDGITVIRRGQQVFGVHVSALLWYLFETKDSFDLVIDQFHGIPFFTPLYVRSAKVAFIHEIAKDVWSLNPWPTPFNMIPSILGNAFEPFIFRFLYKRIPFLTVSESTKRDLMEWSIPLKNITIIHNGTYTSPVSSKAKKRAITFLGALAKDKGIEDAIETFGLIAQSNATVPFWIIGKGNPDYVQFLKSMCKDHGIAERTQFFGFVSDKKKFELLANSYLLLNTSTREGWGLVNIEANSVGTPVAGYDVPGVRDSVVNGKTGILVAHGDSAQLANACLKLLQDTKKYQKFRQSAQAWSRRYTWTEATKKSLNYIENL